jgi:hypothetical protein
VNAFLAADPRFALASYREQWRSAIGSPPPE